MKRNYFTAKIILFHFRCGSMSK